MTTQQQAWDAEAALREPDTTSASTSTATSTELNETPASTTQVEQPAAAAPAAQPDPLEELRKNFLALQQSNTELQQRLANTESVAKAAVGRVSAWQSEQEAARAAAAKTAL